MLESVIFILAASVFFFAGYAILDMIYKDRSYGFLEGLALSYGLGMGAISLFLFFAGWAGMRLNRFNCLVTAAASVLCFIAVKVKNIRMDKIIPGLSPRPAKWKNPLNRASMLLIAIMGIVFVILFVDANTIPPYEDDALGRWSYNAKVLYCKERVGDLYYYEKDLLYGFFNYPGAYPILIPAAENFIYKITGRMDDIRVKSMFIFIFFGIVVSVYSFIRRYLNVNDAVFLSSIAVFLPVYVRVGPRAVSGMADTPLGFFLLLSLINLFFWLRDKDPRRAALAGLFSAFCVFTKNEGLIFFSSSALIILAHLLFKKRLFRPAVLLYVVPPILIAIFWQKFRTLLSCTNQYPSDMAGNGSHIFMAVVHEAVRRMPIIIREALYQAFMSVWNWGIFWVVYVFVFLIDGSLLKVKDLSRLIFFFLPIVYLALIIGYYFVTIYAVAETVYSTFSRILLQVAPAAIIFLSLYWKENFRKEPERAP